jgi:Fe-S-cluster containining protein
MIDFIGKNEVWIKISNKCMQYHHNCYLDWIVNSGKCKGCCFFDQPTVILTDEETKKFKEGLITVNGINALKVYLNNEEGKRYGRCYFLEGEKICTVHKNKPLDCVLPPLVVRKKTIILLRYCYSDIDGCFDKTRKGGLPIYICHKATFVRLFGEIWYAKIKNHFDKNKIDDFKAPMDKKIYNEIMKIQKDRRIILEDTKYGLSCYGNKKEK